MACERAGRQGGERRKREGRCGGSVMHSQSVFRAMDEPGYSSIHEEVSERIRRIQRVCRVRPDKIGPKAGQGAFLNESRQAPT
jgi:hypothetical protein